MALDTTQIKSNIDSELPSSPPGSVRGLGASRLRTALKYIIDWIAASLFNPKGAWAPGTAYAVNEIITQGGSTYRVTTAFTSGSSFSTANLELLAGQGWSPVFAAVVSGSKVVRQLTGWIGGAGVAPGITSGGDALYESSTGLTTNIANATDYRGPRGYAGWSAVFAAVVSGSKVVRQLVDWVGGEGTKPPVTSGDNAQYESSTGLTTNINNATNIRGAQGYAAWSPVFAAIVYGSKVIRQLVDWVGGEGVKPSVTSGENIQYESATGLTTNIDNATDIRGAQGYAGWTVVLANVADGARVVQKVLDMIGGTGTKPSVTGDGGAILYLGAAGFTTDISQATDIRGPIGFNWRGDYAENANYAIGDAFVFRGSTYRVNAAFTAALPFVRTNVTRILRGTWPVGDWVANTQYYEDDIVYNSGSTYRRLVDGLSGATFTGIGTNWGNWSPKGDPGTLTASAFPVASSYDTVNHQLALQKGTTMEKIPRDTLLDYSTLGLADIMPDLTLDFGLSRVVPARINYTRTGTLSYWDKFGTMKFAPANVPVIDYDPVTKACKGFPQWESRTNTNVNPVSPDLWPGSYVTKTTGAATAPDGSSIPSFTSTAGQSSTVQTQVSSMSYSTTYARSLFVKCLSTSNAANKIWVFESNTGAGYVTCRFNLADMTINASAGTTGKIVDCGNGWYRLIHIFTTLASGSLNGHQNYIGAYGGTADTIVFAAWGAQIEAGAFETPLIPNNVTRGFQAAFIDVSGIANQSEGTWIVDFQGGRESIQGLYGRALMGAYNGGGRVLIGLGGATTRISTWPGSGADALVNTTTDFVNTGGKAAMTYINSPLSVSLVVKAVSATSTAPTVAYTYDKIYLGAASVNALNGWIKSVRYYTKALTVNQLKLLTA